MPRRLTLLALLALFPGCGARTGLDAPRLDGARTDAAVPVDAGPADDAGVDAGFDARPECTTERECDDGTPCTEDRCVAGRCAREPHDERCDDGLFCTGIERCAAFSGCSHQPPTCADAVACTVDRCDEEADACAFDPEVTLCPISHRCDPDRGCVARALAHDATFLMEVDLPSGTVHTLGPLPVALTDIALALDGSLYGAIPGELDLVDYMAGTASRVAVVPGRFVALDVAPDGRLYGASNDRVDLLDVILGTRTEVARFPRGYESSGDLAFVAGELLATANRNDPSMDDVLVHIPLDGTRAELIGSIGHPCVWGLAPFGTLLYGLTCEGDLLSIDPTTGAGLVIAHPGNEFFGAAAR